MAESNLLNLLKDAVRNQSRTSTNNASVDERVTESFFVLSCSERSKTEYKSAKVNGYIETWKEAQSDLQSDFSEDSDLSLFSSLTDAKTYLAEMNSEVPQWKNAFKKFLGNDSSTSVKGQRKAVKFFNTRRSPNDEIRTSYYANRNRSNYVSQAKELPQREQSFFKSSSYTDKNRCNYPSQASQFCPRGKEFFRRSSHTNRNRSNYALRMIEAEMEASKVIAQAATFKPYTLKESLNDLAGCGVDVFKISESHRNYLKAANAQLKSLDRSKGLENKPYALKENFNDLFGCGVDVFKVRESCTNPLKVSESYTNSLKVSESYTNSLKVSESYTNSLKVSESYTNSLRGSNAQLESLDHSKNFEIDVPLTGVIAKMKRLTREDNINDPPIPVEEAWDDDLLF